VVHNCSLGPQHQHQLHLLLLLLLMLPGRWAQVMGTLNRILGEQEYLEGSFTAADVAVGGWLMALTMCAPDMDLAPYPNVTAYSSRCVRVVVCATWSGCAPSLCRVASRSLPHWPQHAMPKPVFVCSFTCGGIHRNPRRAARTQPGAQCSSCFSPMSYTGQHCLLTQFWPSRCWFPSTSLFYLAKSNSSFGMNWLASEGAGPPGVTALEWMHLPAYRALGGCGGRHNCRGPWLHLRVESQGALGALAGCQSSLSAACSPAVIR
jgi:hypothetical protein